MLPSLLIGLVAGQRAMTPLALVAGMARNGELGSGPLQRLLGGPLAVFGSVALAAGEMAGDKMGSAPDRTVAAGLLGRSLTAALAGSLLAPRGREGAGAALAVTAALGASFVGLSLRRRAMREVGQVPSGFTEDLLVLAGAAATRHVALARRDR